MIRCRISLIKYPFLSLYVFIEIKKEYQYSYSTNLYKIKPVGAVVTT